MFFWEIIWRRKLCLILEEGGWKDINVKNLYDIGGADAENYSDGDDVDDEIACGQVWGSGHTCLTL